MAGSATAWSYRAVAGLSRATPRRNRTRAFGDASKTMSDWLDELDRLEREATPGDWGDDDGELLVPSGKSSIKGSLDAPCCGVDAELAAKLRNRARELISMAKERNHALGEYAETGRTFKEIADENERLRELLREAQHMLTIRHPEDSPTWHDFRSRVEKALDASD